MLFSSLIFPVFFLIFFAGYWLLRHRLKAQNMLVLAGSYIFYGWWDERFLLLIALSTATDFICGLGAAGPRFERGALAKSAFLMAGTAFAILLVDPSANWIWSLAGLAAIPAGMALFAGLEQLSGPVRRRAYLVTSLAVNLGLLGVFKYFGFFTDSFISAFATLGLDLSGPAIHIILPVGISFYTFQTLSYTIDIYRKNMGPTRSMIDLAAYVSFFPQLVAGPIERARHLLPQFERPREITGERLSSGSLLFLWGLYKKIVIADNLAPIVDSIFADPAAASPELMLVGALAFSFQIYCDFSGYSDMARGLARMLGFDLMLNFNLPYFSRTPSEFWRRWHISLSSWLRDYLYIPLGGNRKGRVLTYRNLFLTMLLGGLWHGAAWTFIAWGVFHGTILCLYRLGNVDALVFREGRKRIAAIGVNVVSWAVMSILTLYGWILFRAESISDAGTAMLSTGQALLTGAFVTRLPALEEAQILFFFIWPLLLVQLWQRWSGRLEFLYDTANFTGRHDGVVRLTGLNLVLFTACAILFLSADGGQQFIYFDF